VGIVENLSPTKEVSDSETGDREEAALRAQDGLSDINQELKTKVQLSANSETGKGRKPRYGPRTGTLTTLTFSPPTHGSRNININPHFSPTHGSRESPMRLMLSDTRGELYAPHALRHTQGGITRLLHTLGGVTRLLHTLGG